MVQANPFESIYIATGNQGKLKEFENIFSQSNNPWPVNFSQVHGRAARDAEETASTFVGNAKIKSFALAKELMAEKEDNFWVISDDSGLEVENLNGEPGVFSARYAGENSNSLENMNKLVRELEKIPEKGPHKARYVCALSLLKVSGAGISAEFESEGYCSGEIRLEAKGDSGFGYDPIFYLPEMDLHMAELSDDKKNEISHRHFAIEDLKKKLKESVS